MFAGYSNNAKALQVALEEYENLMLRCHGKTVPRTSTVSSRTRLCEFTGTDELTALDSSTPSDTQQDLVVRKNTAAFVAIRSKETNTSASSVLALRIEASGALSRTATSAGS